MNKRSNSQRPYFKFRAAELQGVIEGNSTNRSVLEGVLEETSLRKSGAARLVEALANKCLEQLRSATAKTNVDLGLTRSRSTGSSPESLGKGIGGKRESAHTGHAHDSNRNVVKLKPRALTSTSAAVIPPILSEWGNHQATFRPWFFGRLTGRPSTRIVREGECLHVSHRGSSFEVPVSEIQSVRVEARAMSSTFVVETIGGARSAIAFRGICKEQSKGILSSCFSVRFSRHIEAALVEFHALLEQGGYVTHRAAHRWAEEHEKVLLAAADLQDVPEGVNESERLNHWKEFTDSWEKQIELRNDDHVARLTVKWRSFFDRLESNSLTEKQVESILRDDDHTLVVAGAGTGKTSAVVGKIGYLVESGEVAADEILALAFGREAAEEMRDRVAMRTGHDIEIRTFHALGLHIAQEHSGARQSIADTATDGRAFNALIARLLVDIFDDDTTKDLALDFVVHHRYPAKYLEDFDANGDYMVYLRKHEPRTLRGELVKSFEELLIADWLLLNGVNYEYEHAYEFDTASPKRRQYKPDFYLVDSGVYLEHFGIGTDGATAPGIDKGKYHQGIAWKRQLHKEHETVLLETYSWERQQGVLLSKLKSKLRELGVIVKPMDKEQVGALLRQREVSEPLVELLQRFLTIFREGMWTEQEMSERVLLLSRIERGRAESFLRLFYTLSERYKARLSGRQEVDFSDMISQAVRLLEDGDVHMPFRRIVVDEYQDISRGRQKLLKALVKQTDDTRIMCVGDDWQSIYGFTGSDIRMTTEFDSRFGSCTRVDLDQTFRFTKPIMDSSARFIQMNTGQLRKKISAQEPVLENSIELITTAGDEDSSINAILENIDNARPARVRWSVLLLGRYNRLKPDNLESLAKKFKMLDVEFMTIHKSKGLEADAVAVLELKAARYGFPSEVENDTLLELVLPADESCPHAEERRVLYVAMTRARFKVVLVADPHSPSEFVEELRSHPEVQVRDQILLGRFKCPECQRGRLELTNPNRLNGYAWKCTLRPYCSHRAKYCSKCLVAPAISVGKKPMCTECAREVD
jgi:DNA helicase-4